MFKSNIKLTLSLFLLLVKTEMHMRRANWSIVESKLDKKCTEAKQIYYS